MIGPDSFFSERGQNRRLFFAPSNSASNWSRPSPLSSKGEKGEISVGHVSPTESASFLNQANSSGTGHIFNSYITLVLLALGPKLECPRSSIFSSRTIVKVDINY